MPKVSVYMPAYNMEQYIAEAIESILNQTFTDFELIIINDGSTDNTAQIVKYYAARDKRIKFINNKTNRGFIAVSNDGLNAATGEYIAKMDSDDISMPERLARQVEFLDQNPDIGMVGCGLQAFGKDDFVITHSKTVGIMDALYDIPTTCFMARKSIIDQYNLRFDPDFFACEDYEFYIQFLKHAKIANIQDVLYKYRWHGNNVTIQQRETQSKNTYRLRENLTHYLSHNQKLVNLLLLSFIESNRYVRLFGILPIIRIKKYEFKKTKYYLFGKLPLWRVQDNKIYLFDLIKIGGIR